eukprot:GHRR01004602.1.p2 GENE.GHRR01004602.1~~GHRR01004602.1.p2  ORF type:complete len:138 (+),score=31.34 GHRR01004602.1:129-542(+)
MPLIHISTNLKGVNHESKKELATVVTDAFSLKNMSPLHTHVQIEDGQFLCFGGNSSVPAAVVIIKSSEGSISKDARRSLVASLSKALPLHLEGLAADRLYMTFEDLPVQNIAVGDSIMTFDTMRTAKSLDRIAEVAP